MLHAQSLLCFLADQPKPLPNEVARIVEKCTWGMSYGADIPKHIIHVAKGH